MNYQLITCKECDGSGIVTSATNKPGIDLTIIHCDTCKGSGTVAIETDGTLTRMLQHDFYKQSIAEANKQILMYLSESDREYYKSFLSSPFTPPSK